MEKECLLCLELKDNVEDLINIHSNEWKDQNVADIIEKHFWSMSSMKSVSSWLCVTCWLTVSEFHHFYRRIEDVQNYFEDVVKSEPHHMEENKDFTQNILEIIKDDDYDAVSESDIQYALEEPQENDFTAIFSTPSNVSNKKNDKITTNSIEEKFKCPQCNKIVKDEDAVSKHLAWHRGYQLNCEICDLIYTDMNKLIEHKRIHAPKKVDKNALFPYIPEDSQTSFISFSCDENELMEVGEELTDPLNSFSFECKYCSKTLRSKRQMEKHKVWHEGNVNTCNICYIKFFDVNQYETHKALHQSKPKELVEEMDIEEKTEGSIYLEDDFGNINDDSEFIEEISVNPLEDATIQEEKPARAVEDSLIAKEDDDNDSNYSVTTMDIGSGNKLKCPYCPNEYVYEGSYVNHVKKHEKRRKLKELEQNSDDKSISLSLDKEDTNTNLSLPSLEIPNQIFICQYCGRELDNERTLFNHTMWHEGICFQCNECELKFFDETQFENHRTAHSLKPDIVEMDGEPKEQEYFMCTFCSRILSNKRLLINHNAWHLGTVHTCEICDMKFMDKCQFDNHTEGHMPKTWKRCKECRKPFSCAREVILHYNKMHRNAFQNVCDVCGMSYRCPLSFKRHVARHEGKADPKIPCKICGRLLVNKHCLKSHMKINHPEGGVLPYVCHICLKPKATRAILKRHIVMNHNTTGFEEKCKVCGKIYKNLRDAKDHAETHASEKRHVCPWCPEKFTVSNLLSRHRRKAHPVEYAEWKKQLYVQV